MCDIHSAITTTSGYLFYQLVALPLNEVSLRKSVRISLIAVSGSAHKDRLDIVWEGLCWFRVDFLLS